MPNNDLSKEGAPPPRLTPELLGFLDRTFPERCPDTNETPAEIFFKSGQRSVVRYLIRIYEEQNENVL